MFYKSLLCGLLVGVSLSAMEAVGSEGDSGGASGGAGAGFGSSDDSQISIETVELYPELEQARATLKGKPLTQKVLDWSLRIYNVMYPKREVPKVVPPPAAIADDDSDDDGPVLQPSYHPTQLSQRVKDFIKIIDFLNDTRSDVPVEDRASFVLNVSRYMKQGTIPNIFHSINEVEPPRFEAFSEFIADLFARKPEGTSYLFYLRVIYGMDNVPLEKMTEPLKKAILKLPDSFENFDITEIVKDFASLNPESLTDDFLRDYFNLRETGIKPEAKSLDILATINPAFLTDTFWMALTATKDRMKTKGIFDDGLVQKALLFWGSVDLQDFSSENIEKLVNFINKNGFEILDGISVKKAIFIIDNFPPRDQSPGAQHEVFDALKSMKGSRDDILIPEFKKTVKALKLKFQSHYIYADYSFAIDALKGVSTLKLEDVLTKIDHILNLEKEDKNDIYNALYGALISVSSKHLLSFLNNVSFAIKAYPGVPAQDIIRVLSFVEPGKLRDVMLEINAYPNPQKLFVVLNRLWNKRNLIGHQGRPYKEYRDDFEGERKAGFVYLTPELIRLFLTFYGKDIENDNYWRSDSYFSEDSLINSLDQLITKSSGKIQGKIDKFQTRVVAQTYPELTEGLKSQEKIYLIKFLKTQATISPLSPTMAGYLADLVRGTDVHYRKRCINEILEIPEIEKRLSWNIVQYALLLWGDNPISGIQYLTQLKNSGNLTFRQLLDHNLEGLSKYDKERRTQKNEILKAVPMNQLTDSFIKCLISLRFLDFAYAVDLLKNLSQRDLIPLKIEYAAPFLNGKIGQDLEILRLLTTNVMEKFGNSLTMTVNGGSSDDRLKFLQFFIVNQHNVTPEMLEIVARLKDHHDRKILYDDKISFLDFFLRSGPGKFQVLKKYLENFSGQYDVQKAIAQLDSNVFVEPFLSVSKQMTLNMKEDDAVEAIIFLSKLKKEKLLIWKNLADRLIMELTHGRESFMAFFASDAKRKIEVINFFVKLNESQKNNWIENVKVLMRGATSQESVTFLMSIVTFDPLILKDKRLEDKDLIKIKNNISKEQIPVLLKNLEKCH